MLFDRQYMRVLMGLTVSRKICSWIVSIIVWMCSSTSAPGFDEKAGDSSNSERLHFTKASTFRTTTVTYEQQISIKKVKWYQRDNYVFMFFHEPFCNQAFSCLFVSGSCLLMFILNFFLLPNFFFFVFNSGFVFRLLLVYSVVLVLSLTLAFKVHFTVT